MKRATAGQHDFCELVRPAVQQSTDSLSRMLGYPIAIEPSLFWWASEPLPVSKQLSAANGSGVFLNITGDIEGTLLFHLPDASKDWFVQQLLGASGLSDPLSEMACSALKEAGNIIASAFLSSIQNRLGINCLPTPPILQQGTMMELFSSIGSGREVSEIIVKTPFSGLEPEPELQGAIYLFVGLKTVEQLQDLAE